jgi:hypothetical protein
MMTYGAALGLFPGLLSRAEIKAYLGSQDNYYFSKTE